MDYKALKDAGVTQQEFAQLCGVSRVTANLWIKGHFAPNKFAAPKVKELLDNLRRLVDEKKLPLKRQRKTGDAYLAETINLLNTLKQD